MIAAWLLASLSNVGSVRTAAGRQATSRRSLLMSMPTTVRSSSMTATPFLANADLSEDRGPCDCSGSDRKEAERDPAPSRRLPPIWHRSRDPPALSARLATLALRKGRDDRERLDARYKRARMYHASIRIGARFTGGRAPC